MRTAGRILFTLIIIGVGGVLFGQTLSVQRETIAIQLRYVHPESPENIELIDKVIQLSVARANDLYGRYIQVDYSQKAKQALYTVEVTAYFSEDGNSLDAKLTRNRDGSQTDAVPVLGEINARSASHLASTIFYLWSSFHDFLADEMTAPPVYVEEIPLDLTSQSVFGMTGML
ncbi:MAG: hypothetical protein JSV25_14820, partial [Spirochaetota bacterium]